MKLILFDIDGTLLHTGGAGRRAMTRSFTEVFRVNDGFRGISMSGKTDPAILREALDTLGISWNEERVRTFKERYFELLAEEIKRPNPNKRLMPGVKELLKRLAAHRGMAVGLLTGNWRKGGYIKLGHFGIDHFFPFGAFGDDSEAREKLLPSAVKRARRLGIKEIETIWVVGDTPKDVHCATPHGACTLAVATGTSSEEELNRAGATLVLPSLEDVERVLSILEG